MLTARGPPGARLFDHTRTQEPMQQSWQRGGTAVTGRLKGCACVSVGGGGRGGPHLLCTHGVNQRAEPPHKQPLGRFQVGPMLQTDHAVGHFLVPRHRAVQRKCLQLVLSHVGVLHGIEALG